MYEVEQSRLFGEQGGEIAQPLVKGESLDMVTVLLSSVHDMKNSISVMTAYLEGALGAESATTQASHGNDLTRQALYEAQRLNYHLVQILALYKIDSGIYPFDPVEVDLSSFVDEVLARVQRLATAKGVVLETALQLDEPSWYFDQELILSLVVQAMYNALRYTQDRVRLILNLTGHQLEICIEDNGPGYPEFMLASDFPPRLRIDTHSGSTGLGLLFASRVAEMHKNRDKTGAIHLKNGGELGGSCFKLVLP